MAATLEVNYFSTFWLKKINSIVEVKDTTGAADASVSTVITLKSANFCSISSVWFLQDNAIVNISKMVVVLSSFLCLVLFDSL